MEENKKKPKKLVNMHMGHMLCQCVITDIIVHISVILIFISFSFITNKMHTFFVNFT